MLKRHESVESLSSPDEDLSFALSTRFYLKDAESTGYVSSDRVGVSFTERSAPSSVIARREFEDKIKAATNVIEQVPLIDANGRVIGTRVVDMFPTKYKDIESAAVCWITKAGNYSVESISLAHALRFERSFRERFPSL